MLFLPFSGLLGLIVLTQVWFERSSPPCSSSTKKLSLTIKTDYIFLSIQETLISTGSYGLFGGEWVNLVFARRSRGLLSIYVESFVNKQVNGYRLEIIICPCYLYIYKCFVKNTGQTLNYVTYR